MGSDEQDSVRDYVVYLRKSKGRAGIERQRKENLAYAKRVRGRVVETFVDTDATAFAKLGEDNASRPEFERMLNYLRDDDRDPPLGIIAWHADRLLRNGGEVRPFAAACAKGGHLVETPRSGVYDLTTPNGRKRLRDDVSDAEHEVDHLIERIDSQKAEAAAEGRWLGGKRPFGFTADGVGHEPAEAEAIRWACDAALAGTSMHSVAREWNARGLSTPRLKTTGGNPWTPTEVRRVLLRPRNAGLMLWRGQVVGKAAWEPLVSEASWRAVVRLLTDPGRRTTPGPERRWLGSGIYLCGVCDGSLVTHATGGRSSGTKRTVYRCGPGEHVMRDAGLLDRYVGEHVIAWLSRPDAGDLLLRSDRTDLAALEAELLELREDLAGWRADAASGEVTRLAFKPVEKRLLGQIAEVEAKLIRPDRALILRDLIEAEDVGAEWEGTPLDRKRAVVGELFAVTVHKAPKGRPKGWRPGEPYFDTDSVDVKPV